MSIVVNYVFAHLSDMAFVVLLYMSCRCKLGCIHRVVLYTRVTQTYSFIIYFQIGNRQTLIQGIIKKIADTVFEQTGK